MHSPDAVALCIRPDRLLPTVPAVIAADGPARRRTDGMDGMESGMGLTRNPKDRSY